jgi:uncharacterized protein YoxC
MRIEKLKFALIVPAALLMCATVFGQSTAARKAGDATEKTVDGTIKAAKKTKEVTVDAAEGTGKVAKKVGKKTKEVAGDVAEGSKTAGRKTKEVAGDVAEGSKKVGNKTKEVAGNAADATASGARKTVAVTKGAVAKVTGKDRENAPGVSDTQIANAQKQGMVWVNTDSGIYHNDGAFFGKTKEGKFMTEADAKKAGYRAAK